MIVGLVNSGFGTWRDIMSMDIENAINTYRIVYINRYNENLYYENLKAKNG